MDVNYINYPVLEKGVTVYEQQAEAILDIVDTLTGMNEEMQDGWSNKTARALVDRIKTDHFEKLKRASEALSEVSKYITTYGLNRKDEDTEGASAISG